MNVEVTPAILLEQLGIERVIWIDDHFDDSIEHLFDAIKRTPQLVKSMPYLEATAELLNDDDEPHDESEFEQAVREILESLKPEENSSLREILRKHAAVEEGKESEIASPPEDLEAETAMAICKMLGINEDDCKGFEDGLSLVNDTAVEGSTKTAIIVDMQNSLQGAGLGNQAGLRILEAIYARKGDEMVFVLTHEAFPENESEREAKIVEDLESAQRFPSVISKKRLKNKSKEELEVALKIALKRSALRREVYNVGEKAQSVVAESLIKTRDIMCQIPPEELDHAFVQRAISEGVSDLHMIERIISAQVSKSVKRMFVEDQDMHGRMRMLRGIQINTPAVSRHDVIEQFRHDEIWEDGDFLAAGRAPLALGDVFETVSGDTKRQFILLGQPCDIALRKNGKRSGIVGDLLSFADADEKPKGERSTDLLVGKGGKYVRFNFYNVSPSQLNLLDLATFNATGSVSIQSDQEPDSTLLVGQAKQLANAKRLLNAVIAAQKKAKDNPKDLRKADAKCKLTLRFDGHFNSICTPTFSEANGVSKLDWNLRRSGRLRSPYVDKLMDDHMAHLGRRAFEIDYLDEKTGYSAKKDQNNEEAATEAAPAT
jgi:hypothetical protein